MSELLKNVHEKCPSPAIGQDHLVRGDYLYYHYGCDGINDEGWGCGYRTLQTICSWITFQRKLDSDIPKVPSIVELQQALVTVGDKPQHFLGSRQWIGSIEVSICIDHFYGVSCRIVHVNQGADLFKFVPKIQEHFVKYGSPLMMGGDKDASSKGILGVCQFKDKAWLLVLDPHLRKRLKSAVDVQSQGWLSWTSLDSFVDSSFYNICFPLLEAN